MSGMGMIKAWLGQKAASMESAEDGDGVIRRRRWGQQETALKTVESGVEDCVMSRFHSISVHVWIPKICIMDFHCRASDE